MMSEPEERLKERLENSPFEARHLRSEIYDFLEEKVKDVFYVRNNVQKRILEGSLRFFISEIDQKWSSLHFIWGIPSLF